MFIMEKFYSLLKNGILSFTFSLGSFIVANAQTSVCGNVVENFDNTGGSTAGFTGSFGYSAANEALQRNNVLSSSTYSVSTPTYQLGGNATTIGYGFILGGSVQGSS